MTSGSPLDASILSEVRCYSGQQRAEEHIEPPDTLDKPNNKAITASQIGAITDPTPVTQFPTLLRGRKPPGERLGRTRLRVPSGLLARSHEIRPALSKGNVAKETNLRKKKEKKKEKNEGPVRAIQRMGTPIMKNRLCIDGVQRLDLLRPKPGPRRRRSARYWICGKQIESGQATRAATQTTLSSFLFLFYSIFPLIWGRVTQLLAIKLQLTTSK